MPTLGLQYIFVRETLHFTHTVLAWYEFQFHSLLVVKAHTHSMHISTVKLACFCFYLQLHNKMLWTNKADICTATLHLLKRCTKTKNHTFQTHLWFDVRGERRKINWWEKMRKWVKKKMTRKTRITHKR